MMKISSKTFQILNKKILSNTEFYFSNHNFDSNIGFTNEIIDMDDEENVNSGNVIFNNQNNDYNKDEEIDLQNKLKNKKKNTYKMDRISEVEYEDEKHTTLFDKIDKEINNINKEDLKINENNIDYLLANDLHSSNLRDLVNPALYNEENLEYNFKPEINKNSQLYALSKEESSSSKRPIEVKIPFILLVSAL